MHLLASRLGKGSSAARLAARSLRRAVASSYVLTVCARDAMSINEGVFQGRNVTDTDFQQSHVCEGQEDANKGHDEAIDAS